MQIDGFVSATLAIILLFVGKGLIARVELLRRYSIPEALVGGVLCALVVCLLYYQFALAVHFDLRARDTLLLYFFAAIGLNTSLHNLRLGGRPLLLLGLLSVAYIVLQDILGMSVAGLFGMDPRAGLMTGSIALIGGVGTTVAWAPYFTDTLGISQAEELGLAANMIGVVAACVIGGPIASVLMQRHRILPSNDSQLEVSTRHGTEQSTVINYHGFLLALLWLNFALMLGDGLNHLISQLPIRLPAFVGCLLAGIALRAGADLIRPNGQGRLWKWQQMQPSLALVSDICLGLFLTMALMGLRFWELQPVALFIAVVMLLQIVLCVAFTLLVVFPAMGRDYEATVICAGFGGIALGSTASAIANMSAVTRQFGAARRAFIVVPLVCSFVTDLANSLVIGLLAG